MPIAHPQPFSHPKLNIPLRWVLVVPFVLQTVGAVTLVGYLSFRSGQRVVENLAHQLMTEVGNRTTLYLDKTLEIPHLVNELNADAISLGTIPNFQTEDTEVLEKFFGKQINRFPSVSTIAIANERGGMVGSAQKTKTSFPSPDMIGSGQKNSISVYRTERFAKGTYSIFDIDAQGNKIRTQVIVENYDARIGPWYQTPKQAGKATWSPIYQFIARTHTLDLSNNESQRQAGCLLYKSYWRCLLGISAGLPIYNSSGKFQGVLATDITLDRFNQFLSTLHISPSGQVFMIERSGLLIASSTDYPLFKLQGEKLQRTKAAESTNPIIRETTAQLTKRFQSLNHINNIEQFDIEQPKTKQFVQVIPYRDRLALDWLIVIVVPESDFTAEIQANNYRTALLCGLALMGSILLGLWTARKITQPIQTLNLCTQAFSAGKPVSPLSPTGIQEVDALRVGINQMMTQLNASFQALQENEQQVAEQTKALRESKTQLQLITDSVPGCISYVDASQRYRFVNKTYEAWFNCQKEDIFGKTIQEVIGLEAYHQVLPYITQALAGKTATYEGQLPDQGNHTRDISAVLVPDMDEHQVVHGYYALITDISEQQAALRERKRAEAALRESEARFRLAFDDAAIGMALIALDGQFMEVNQALCDLLGYTETELLQKTCWAITHPEDFQEIEENVQQLLSGEQRSFQIKKRCIHKQGKVIWTMQSTSAIREQNGTPFYCVSQIQDISDRQVAERVKDEFISVVSHELRTPLTSICGALGILQSGKFDNQSEKFQYFLQIAVNNSIRLVRLINDILDLERLESDSVELLIEECEASELMKQAVEAVQTLASQASITIQVVPISVNLWASSGAIVQVITNLLSNAIKFSPSGGTIWLKAELVNQEQKQNQVDDKSSNVFLRFSVQDQGRGIPPEKLDSIFERFQQVDASDSRQRGGTGLGLAICKSIVQKHKGEIWVDSVLGEGSTFYFTIGRSGKDL